MPRSRSWVIKEEVPMQITRLARAYVESVDLSPSTLDNYSRAYTDFVGYLKNKLHLKDDVDHFNAENIEAWAEALRKEEKLLGKTVNQKLSALSSLAKWALGLKAARILGLPKGKFVLQENPVVRVERPVREHYEAPFLFADEIGAVLACGDAKPNELLVRDLAADTGLRSSELRRLNVGQLRLDSARNRLVLLHIAISKQRGKATSTDIILDAELSERLQAWLDERFEGRVWDAKAPLLINQAGERYTKTAFYQVIAKIAERAGVSRVKIGPHALARHTTNTVGRQQKIDPLVRSKILNHSNSRTIEHYDHVAPDETFAAREVIRGALREYREKAAARAVEAVA